MRTIGLVLLVCLIAGGVWAFQPTGWLFSQWPYAYSMNEGAWYYFNLPCSQYCVNLSSGVWQFLSGSGTSAGWNHYQWPYCYSMTAGGWYYMDVNSVQWCVNLNNAQWSRYGTPDASGLYLAIDLSGGAGAASYPVSYLTAVPPGGWTDEYKTSKLVLRKITKTAPGAYTMGSPVGELGRDNSETQHQVTLTKDFYIGVFEVTQEQWNRVMGNWPSYFDHVSYRATRPVEYVSYDDIRGSSAGAGWPGSSAVDSDSFMGRLRAKTGLAELDLPTDSQWEYACRAGTATALNSGYNLTNEQADIRTDAVGRYFYNGGGNSSQGVGPEGATALVGTYMANQWGLYDMHGNVWEWCLDWAAYPGDVTDPKGAASGSDRVFRGGGWHGLAGYCRSANRGLSYPNDRYVILGFRVSRTLP